MFEGEITYPSLDNASKHFSGSLQGDTIEFTEDRWITTSTKIPFGRHYKGELTKSSLLLKYDLFGNDLGKMYVEVLRIDEPVGMYDW